MSKPRLDKTAIRVIPLEEEGDDRAFWATKTPAERLAALEYLRQVTYGYDSTSEGLQRVLTVVERT